MLSLEAAVTCTAFATHIGVLHNCIQCSAKGWSRFYQSAQCVHLQADSLTSFRVYPGQFCDFADSRSSSIRGFPSLSHLFLVETGFARRKRRDGVGRGACNLQSLTRLRERASGPLHGSELGGSSASPIGRACGLRIEARARPLHATSDGAVALANAIY